MVPPKITAAIISILVSCIFCEFHHNLLILELEISAHKDKANKNNFAGF